MFKTMKRAFLATERRFNQWSVPELTFRDYLKEMGLVFLTCAAMSIGLVILWVGLLLVAGPALGLLEPLAPGEYQAIQQIHQNGQVVTA